MAGSAREHSSGEVTLLRTKLAMPRPRSRRVERPRLEALLERSLERKLAVVCSPAGFGKTTLIAAWLAKTNARVGWLSLDEYDNRPLRFWSYVAAALENALPGSGSEAIAMLASQPPPPIEVVLTDLLNAASAALEESLLVLDDYHFVTDPAVHSSLQFFLSHLPPTLHVILIGREEPPLGLAAYRAKAELIEITADELRFSPGEAGSFLREVAGIALEERAVASLVRVTEGWAAALQLAALTLEGADDPERLIDGFSGDNEYLFSYLAEEVFGRLDSKLQGFLLRTALLERFCAELCDEIAAGAGGRAQLQVLGQLNLFLVPLDSAHIWFRYHGLFRDFLQALGRRLLTDEERRAALRSASRWFAGQGLASEAIRYAFDAKDEELAADHITRLSGLFFDTSDLVTLRNWIARLPSQILASRPLLCFVAAWSLLATGRAGEVERFLAMIESSLGVAADGSEESRDTPPRTRCALAEISVIRSSLAFIRLDPKEIEGYCLRAVEYLPEKAGEFFFNPPESIRATAQFNLAIACENEGDIERATSIFEQSLKASRETENIHLVPMITAHLGNLRAVQGRLSAAEEIHRGVVEASVERPRSPLAGLAYVGYGSVLLERNHIEEAVAHLTSGVDLGRRWANWEVVLPGMLALARADVGLGFPDHASERIDDLARLAVELDVPSAARSVVGLYEALYGQPSEESAAASLARARDLLQGSAGLPYLYEVEAIVSCRLLLKVGAAAEAAGHLAGLEAAARKGGRRGRLIEVLALESIAESATSRHEAAEEHLAEALDLAEPEGYLRVFLELGSPMVRLLESVSAHASYRRRLLDAVSGGPSEPTPAGLSEREIEVLRDLAAGFSNQETSERLFISVNTVKTHLKHIFTKLGVASRTQAVARARELGLLPGDRRS